MEANAIKKGKVRSKRFSIHEASPLPSETLVQGTESSVQPAETSTVVVTTAGSKGIAQIMTAVTSSPKMKTTLSPKYEELNQHRGNGVQISNRLKL